MSNDSTIKMLIVALGVCLVCSVLVSTAAVSLSSIQDKNKEADKIRNILVAGDLMQDTGDVHDVFANKIEPTLVDLKTGTFVPKDQYNEKIDPSTFDVKAILDDPEYSVRIPADEDVANIGKMPTVMSVYIVKNGDTIEKYILPIYGKGLWSTMYGFIAIDSDLETVRGITFYDHGETPGLGGEIENPKWQAIWKGKKIFKENGEVGLTVIKGTVDPGNPNSKYQIDGLSGSTLTTRGLDAMVQFWMGDNGYGPFINQLETQKDGENEQS